MYKNQLQELAQRSCFSLPSYTCIREGPDHAPRFKASVTFNGETFTSPAFCNTLRQAEHAAALQALQSLATNGGPSSTSLAARILDETGVYKNLLQEVAQRVGAPLPSYSTFRSGLGHLPIFTGTVELADIIFTGEPAKSKKQAEKNAAMAAWILLKQLAREAASSTDEPENNDEQEQITIARALLNYRLKEKMAAADNLHTAPFMKMLPVQQDKKPSLMQPPPPAGSKILPLIQPKSGLRTRPTSPAPSDRISLLSSASSSSSTSPPFQMDKYASRPQKFPAAGAPPYVPVHHFRASCRGMAPPVTIRTTVPCYAAPPLPPPSRHQLPPVINPPVQMAPPIRIRPVVPVFAAPRQTGSPATAPSIAPGRALPSGFQQIQINEKPAPAAPPGSQTRIKDDQHTLSQSVQVQIKENLQVVFPPPAEIQVKDKPEKPQVPGSSEIGPAVCLEDFVDSIVNDDQVSAAIESLKRLEL